MSENFRRDDSMDYEDQRGLPPTEQPEEKESAEMGFFDHLEELRWRIIKSLIALVITSIACGVFYDKIWYLLLTPAFGAGMTKNDLLNTEPFGQVTLTIQICIISGLILGIPFILWQLWAFIRPGLYKTEQRYVGWIAVATIFCFVVGVLFAYVGLIPATLDFAMAFQASDMIENQFTIQHYFSFILGFILASGVVFEMPVLSWALTRLGIITPQLLRKYRRHAIVILLIVAGIITPTPDPINQGMMAAPLYGLYELSILVSVLARRQRDKAMDDVTQ